MMVALFRNRLTAIWLLLVLATVFSWDSGKIGNGVDPRFLALFVITVAFVKVRFIGLEFMELRQAPAPLRLLFEGWVVLVGGAVMASYWFGF